MSKKVGTKHLALFLHDKFGGGWFSDFTKYLKDHKIISKGLSLAAPALGKYGAVAEVGSKIADWFGFGSGLPPYKLKDLKKYASHKMGSGWMSDFASWVKDKYKTVKDHVIRHKDLYTGLLHEFKPVNKIAHTVIDKLPLYDHAKESLHKLNDENIGFGKKPISRRKKKKIEKETPLKEYGKGFKNGQIP